MSRRPRLALAGDGTAADDAVVVEQPTVRFSTRRLIIGAVLLAALVAGGLVWFNQPAANSAIAGSTEITAAELEQQYGVDIDVVGLIASGGLVELKFRVIDADKATALFGAVADMPVLAVEGSDKVLDSSKGMKHGITLLSGASYFFLYTNVGNAVHAGSQVSFVVDGVRLAHIEVQQ